MPDDLNSEIRIRPARADEADLLSAIAREAKSLWGYPPEWLELWRSQLTIDPAGVERMIVLVAELSSTPIGFGALDRVDGGLELAHLWVTPAYTRRRVGWKLLTALIDAAREVGAQDLRIESDPQAERFYLRAGAERIGSVAAPMPGAPDRVLPLLRLRL